MKKYADGHQEFWLKVAKTVDHYVHFGMRAARGMIWDVVQMRADRPVFVVGCSRAGTTLVYRTFSESSSLGSLKRETHEYWGQLHPLEKRGWRSHVLSADDASDADRKAITRLFYTNTGRRRFVDKNNQNGLAIPYLYALYPDAHFVYVKRSPGDNINSLIEGWQRPEAFGAWSLNMPASVAVEGGRYQRWCFFLPEGWESYLDAAIESVCAYQYRAVNEMIMDARDLIPERQWDEIRYEDVLVDPVGEFQKAFEHAGLPFDGHMRTHCSAVLSNPYNAFSEVRKDKWQTSPNALKIESVLPQVEDVAGRMGY